MIQFPISYPLTLSFKFLAFAPQFSVKDANGKTLAWTKQKLFQLREAVTVFSDESMSQILYTINADRMMDFGARYHFSDGRGKPLGSVQRFGLKSLWRAHYDILDSNATTMSIREPANVNLTIREENPWIKVVDGLISLIPLAELLTGLILHPAYMVSRKDRTAVMRIKKVAAFAERRFTVEKILPLDEVEEQRVLLSLIMLVLLERDRG